MSFQKFCRNIYIEVEDDMTTLYADVKDNQDKYNRSALVLDEYLGTSEGRFPDSSHKHRIS